MPFQALPVPLSDILHDQSVLLYLLQEGYRVLLTHLHGRLDEGLVDFLHTRLSHLRG